ncbi:TonB-dependent receptor [Spirosoma utsteinense]|uniref:Iron complex outermembrane receptor protein n=1 Tax=Spirosoma utsteinense TaxID=2585773 RepID=A0ABR6WDL6_9BACT|nr:TonB-dependent receptor [Spirosoma utsteinense]MBC3788346.1 iron complex outermembrane receptor protein [Spirosoma utsteinense]MBC3794263.1 iron complex outermembrane receptor protein [Spirosoma utsteinense]
MKRFCTLFFIVFTTLTAGAQTQKGAVRGQVTTADGQPAPYVNVLIKSTNRGTITNEQGQFTIKNIPVGASSLLISLVGQQTLEKPVDILPGEVTTVAIELSETAQQLQEVNVSGSQLNRFVRSESDYVSRMPLKNLENPQVYNTIGKELLTEQLVFSVDDAMRNAPGVQRMWEATGRAGDGGSFYNTRGFIVQSQLRNGLAGNVTSSIDVVNLEKLEVIKGPSATLFGSALTSYGGLINRVTKKPYDTFGGEVSYAGGSYGFNRVSLDVNTPLNPAKSILFRMNGAFNYEDNFQNQGFNRSLALAPSLSFQVNNRLSIHLDGELMEGSSVGKQIIFFYYPAAALGASRADELNLDYRNSYMGSGLSQKTRSTNLFGRVNYRISPQFTSSTYVTSSHSYSNGISPYFYLVPNSVANPEPTAISGNFLARADQSTNNSRNEVFEVQQNFNGDFRLGSLRNRIVIGLDYLRINSNQNFFGSVFDTVPLNVPGYDYSTFNGTSLRALYAAGPPQFIYPITTKSNTYSAFISDVLNLTDRLSMLAALRVDHFQNQGGLAGAEVPSFDQTALSPKFGLVFQPVIDQVSLFANYQNSFTNRGTYNAYDITAPDSIARRIAKLERANQFEAGVKLSTRSGKVSATVNYYNIHVSNLLRTDPNPLAAARFAQTQDGTQLSKGIEVDIIANPFKGFNAVAGFSYNDSRLTKADADVNGRRPSTASSPYLANLWLSYRLPDNLVKGLGFGVGGNYASDNKIMNSISQGVFILPAYTILNASAFYEQRKFRLSAKVDNFTNERYWIGYTTMNPQKLRSFVASAAYKF